MIMPARNAHASHLPAPVSLAPPPTQRLKKIETGKRTSGYVNYTTSVALSERVSGLKEHPATPDASERVSKRLFESRLAAWRLDLHAWDNPAEALASAAASLGSSSRSSTGRSPASRSASSRSVLSAFGPAAAAATTPRIRRVALSTTPLGDASK